jgi:hypothetical protein
MTINEIIIEALNDPSNWELGEINWNYIDSDLWLHPDAMNYTDDEKFIGLEFFPDNLIPKKPKKVKKNT